MSLLSRRYKGKLNADADEFIDFAVDGARRMQTLINDLLEYSRAGSPSKPLELTDVNEVVERARSNLKVAIEESGAVVTHDVLPVLKADATQLTQLFQNLVGNGIKFRGESPPAIHIGVKAGPEEFTFSVRDNGIGIDPRYFPRIFLIFQRLHGRGEYSGNGIGLAVCKKIVERHGGRIWVESQPGQGCVFRFTMPSRGKSNGK